jgi:hypothetical protein
MEPIHGANLEMPPVVQLFKSFVTFFGRLMFISCLQEPSNGPYSESDYSSQDEPIFFFLLSILILFTHLRLYLPSGLFPSFFPTKFLQSKDMLINIDKCGQIALLRTRRSQSNVFFLTY